VSVQNAIKDEFTDLPVSRQRKFQMGMRRDKRCQTCGEPVVVGDSCLKHLVKQRESQRRTLGLKRRYSNTLSYRLEAEAEAADRRQQNKKPPASLGPHPVG
jgi:hypothetical protein